MDFFSNNNSVPQQVNASMQQPAQEQNNLFGDGFGMPQAAAAQGNDQQFQGFNDANF